MRDPEFDPVADVFRDSFVYRMSRAVIEPSAVASGESSALNRLRTITRRFTSQSGERQVHTTAVTIAIASLAHLAIRELLPRYATSGLPWWWNAIVAAFALFIAMLAAPIASASADSMPATWWRRMTT